MAAYYKDYRKHINKLCGQNTDFFFVSQQVVCTVTAVVYKGLKMLCHRLM
jgi:hypothetical protein